MASSAISGIQTGLNITLGNGSGKILNGAAIADFVNANEGGGYNNINTGIQIGVIMLGAQSEMGTGKAMAAFTVATEGLLLQPKRVSEDIQAFNDSTDLGVKSKYGAAVAGDLVTAIGDGLICICSTYPIST